MYKAFQNKKYYLAFNTFRKPTRTSPIVYYTGFHKWTSDDMYNYSIVIYRFRIIFGIKRTNFGCCNGG